MSNLKDGKVLLSDREKYRQLSVDTGDVLTVPPALRAAFDEAGLACKWVSKSKIARHGGYHPTKWIPYEISEEIKKKLPKTYLGNVVTNHLERGDLILAVKPAEMQEAHKKELRQKTARQLEAYHQELDAKGKPILRDEE